MPFSKIENGIQKKWDSRYESAADAGEPARILADSAHLLPANGHALDLACGMGANSLFLAQQGFHASAWDISTVAITKLRATAACKGLVVDARLRDCERFPPEARSLDVLVVSNFLYRPILPALIESLRPGGVIVYTTHTLERPDFMDGPANPEYLLRRGELLAVFGQLAIHAYREDGLTGDIRQGERGRASIVASR